jgi:hypothetical protein
MTEVRDRDSSAPDFGAGRMPSATATVAFHTFEGMVAEGRAVRVGMSEGTRSLYISHHLPTWSRMNVVEMVGATLTVATEAVVEQTLVEHLREDEHREALNEAVSLVQAVDSADVRALLLTVVGLLLPEQDRHAALRDALDLANAVDQPHARAALMAVLESPRLEQIPPEAATAADTPEEHGDVSDPSDADTEGRDAELMVQMAWDSIRRHGAAVEVDAAEVPELTDEPVENVKRLFDLTYADLARLFGITERHVYRWRDERVPAERADVVNALQALGLTVIGGLGPEGARKWLFGGEPSPADLVTAGRVDELKALADKYRDSAFT